MLSPSLSILFMSCFIYGSYANNAYTNGLVPVTKFGTKSYYFSNFKATYINAIGICNKFGMQLVSIPNEEVNNFLYQTINAAKSATRYWTSGTDMIVSRNWIWLPAAQPVTYTNWAPNQPDSLADQCIEVVLHKNVNLLWNNLRCQEELKFICESRDDNDCEKPTTHIQCTSTNNQCTSETPSFYIGEETVTHDTARAKCEDRGQMLVSIQDEAKQAAVDAFIKESGYKDWLWTSGNRVADKETWRWLSGETVKYFFWNTGEPNNSLGNEECISIITTEPGSVWNDAPCDYQYYYICESKPVTNCCCNQPPVVNVYINNEK